MSHEYNGNLEEGKLPLEYIDDKSNKKLGIILEENNLNNSELEKSKDNSKEESNINKTLNDEKENSSCKNYTVNLQILNNLFIKENEEEKDKKYNTLNSFPNKDISRLLNNITNNTIKNLSNEKDETYNNDNDEKIEKNNNIDNNDKNKLNENNNNSKDFIILSSNKKQSELIKLLSSNKIDNIGKDNITKNINLNININNNIQYEIEKNKEKDEYDNNSDLNKSLNSLIKIAEKNCVYLNDSISSNIYIKNRPMLNNKSRENNNEKSKEEKKKIQKCYFSTLEPSKNNNSENIALSLLDSMKRKNIKNQLFKRVKSQNVLKNKKNKDNNIIIEKMNVTNNIEKLNNIFPLKENNKNNNIINQSNNSNNEKNNISNNKNNIYSKKKSSRRYNSINKNIRNLSLNKQENLKNISNNIKKFYRNNASIDKELNKKNEGENFPDFTKLKKNIYTKDAGSLYQRPFEKYNKNNYSQIKDKKFGQNNGFFEVNISLNNCFKNEQFENSLEESNNKIYKRPTRLYNTNIIIKKGKSVDKINKNNKYITDEENIFRKRNKPRKKMINRTNTNNYFLNKNDKKQITYIKKNPHIQTNINNNNNFNINYNINNLNKSKINDINYNIGYNTNTHFINKTNRNFNNMMRKERNSLNNFQIRSKSPLENYNYNKYHEIYDTSINNKNKYIKKNILSLNLEDLMVLEEKLCEIIIEFKKKKKAQNQCFDFWNYYFNFSLYQKIEKLFKNEADEEIVRLSLNYELMSILICYDFSLKNENILDYSLFIEILQLCHRNLTLILEQILNKICPENQNNVWVIKLSEIVQCSKTSSEQIFSTENYIQSLIGKINFNTNCLIKKIKNLIYNINYENKNILNDFVKDLNQKTYEEINDFFREYIYKVDNFEGSILSSIIKTHTDTTTRTCPPYIKDINLKKYSLVLDLNETLISFKLTKGNQGLVRTRPFLFEFLDSIGQFYEIILFTCSTQNYADSIIKAIEYKKKYFDYIFYRQHTISIKNDFVKDLTRIGRPLDSIIIIDNMPQNFRLQKENGINIKSFWGDNSEDTALYDLIPILISIANENQDVREGLTRYRDEIVKKVTSNICKHNI